MAFRHMPPSDAIFYIQLQYTVAKYIYKFYKFYKFLIGFS